MINSMDEKVLRVISVMSVFLTVIVCICLQFFPDMHAKIAMAKEAQQLIASGKISNDVAIENIKSTYDVVEENEDLEAQLKIELPDKAGEKKISAENDCYNHVVYLHFSNGVDDFFSNYKISGSSDHILSLSYYMDGSDGVIVFVMDKIYIPSWKLKNGNLYLDFLEPHKAYDKIVVVDAGHGERAVGACRMDYMEKDINLDILLKLKEYEENTDDKIGFFYTRTSDANPTLEQRVGLANELNADLFISIHSNTSGSGNYSDLNGTQVLYSEDDDGELTSKKFANICLECVTGETGSNEIGLLEGNKIHIIRNSKVPVALIEVGFMTNKEELMNLVSSDYQEKIAKGIYKAIQKAFEEGY